MPPIVVCKDCKEEVEHYGHGKCKSCYMIWYRSRPGFKEKHAARMKRYREEKPEIYQAIENRRNKTSRRQAWKKKYWLEYYEKNAEKLRQYQRDWRKNNPEQRDEYKRQYRNRKKGLQDTLTLEEWQYLLAQSQHSCVYCERSDVELVKEHFYPASKGGGYTKGNIVPACQTCNARKGDRVPDPSVLAELHRRETQ